MVVANLTVNGVCYGPHGFLVEMTTKGISAKDMGDKTTFNALDNAEIALDHVRVPHSCLLARYAHVVNNKYVLKVEQAPSFITIAQVEPPIKKKERKRERERERENERVERLGLCFP